MKKITFLLLFCVVSVTNAQQQLRIKKGVIVDSLAINDSISESFALYLPKSFTTEKKWPIIYVFDMQGRGKKALSMFMESAESQGYVLAASNDIRDSLSLSENVLKSGRLFSTISSIFPINERRKYTAGFGSGARFASINAILYKEIKGVISCGASIANIELLDVKKPMHFVGVVGREDYNYPEMLQVKKMLNLKKIPNQLIVFEGEHRWPSEYYIEKAMKYLTISAMTNKIEKKDTLFIDKFYKDEFNEVVQLNVAEKPLLANHLLNESIKIFGFNISIDSLKNYRKSLRRSRLFKEYNTNQNKFLLKESFIINDYNYYMEEDLQRYNYNNLGWWSYQMEELNKFEKSTEFFQKQMAVRLKGYLGALLEDNIESVKYSGEIVDEEALRLLYMLKTIINPKVFSSYLEVISLSSKVEDFGTALFYLEELLKQGYTNKTELYSVKNTALLRISPEFNELVTKYLNQARYDVIQQ